MGESPFKPPAPALRLHSAAVRANSRSPTRATKRRSLFLADELDPLLSNLSPQATLQALSNTDIVPANREPVHEALTKSISDVSTVDRAFGIRAAVAAQKLKEWLAEVVSWDWPKGAEAGFLPPSKNPVTNVELNTVAEEDAEEQIYFGYLPAKVVETHEDRIEEIKDDMDSLGVDELKEHVLNVHIASRSRPVSSNSVSTNNGGLSYTKLSDFTAVITATILRTLPVLNRLNILLSSWDVRLSVLRQVPGLLLGLKEANGTIDNALNRLKKGVLPDLDDSLFSRESFGVARKRLEKIIASLGGQMDGILDMLEGREEVLPDVWIDDMEDVEARFATWAFEAEKRAVENEWRCKNLQEKRLKDIAISHDKKPKPAKDEALAVDTPIKNMEIINSTGKSSGPFVHSEVTQSSKPGSIGMPGPVSNEKPVQSKIASKSDRIESTPTRPILDNDNATSSEIIERRLDAVVYTHKLDDRLKDSSELGNTSNNPSPSINHANVSHTAEVKRDPSPIFPAKENTQLSENNDGKSVTKHSQNSSSRTYLITPNVSHVDPNDKPNKLNSTDLPHRGVHSKPERPVRLPTDNPIKDKKPIPKPLPQLPSSRKELLDRPFSSSSAASSSISYGSNLELGAAQLAESHGTPIIINSPDKGSADNPIVPRGEVAFDKVAPGLGAISPLETDTLSGSRPTVHRSTSMPLARYVSDNSDMEDHGERNDKSLIKKASTASFEVVPKAELRSITINKRASSKPLETSVKQNVGLRKSASSQNLSSTQRLKQRVSRGTLSGMLGLSNPKRSSSTDKSSKQQLPAPPGSPDPTVVPTKAKKPASKLHQRPRTPSQNPRSHVEEKSPKNAPPIVVAKRSKQSTMKTPARSPDDHLDKKINTLLNTIPARIRLGSSSDRSPDGSNDLRPPQRTNRMQSSSPSPSRSSTPTPLTITPAVARSKRRHANADDESSVRLYHLHRGGTLAPAKLFVRLVGDGERVMVRVGGGWADLGEYLREYAAHHGRRNIPEGRIELQDIPSNRSPSAYSRNSRATTPTNGRATPAPPSRPGSAFDNRPSSSLAVRKTRKSVGSHGANLPNLTAANIQKATEESAGPGQNPFLPSRRRLSVSSTNSMSMSSTIGDYPRALSTATAPVSAPHSKPLGLAGPKPRPRQVSISPESEAWVEDVVGQARMSSATLRSRKSNSALRPLRETDDNTEDYPTRVGKVRSHSNLRSVSDMGSVSMNRRVFLRRMSKGKE